MAACGRWRLAYGTESIPKVDVIVGPGNKYVTAAKRHVFGDVAIDMIAGPSEVCIISDRSVSPAIIAADLLAQAEHDEMAAPLLITLSDEEADRVILEAERQIASSPRTEIVQSSMRDHGVVLS